MKNLAKGLVLATGMLLSVTSYSKNTVIAGNKIAGFTFHPNDGEACQANSEEKYFNFCSKQAISKYNEAIKIGKPNYNAKFNIVRFDVKNKYKSGTYAETFLAIINPKTREVYPFPYVVSYDRFSSISKTQYPKISYSQNSDAICSLDKTVMFYGGDLAYKMWEGKQCFALEKDDDGLHFPTMPISSYR